MKLGIFSRPEKNDVGGDGCVFGGTLLLSPGKFDGFFFLPQKREAIFKRKFFKHLPTIDFSRV